jgi:hypothetical protein
MTENWAIGFSEPTFRAVEQADARYYSREMKRAIWSVIRKSRNGLQIGASSYLCDVAYEYRPIARNVQRCPINSGHAASFPEGKAQVRDCRDSGRPLFRIRSIARLKGPAYSGSLDVISPM